MLNLPVIVGFGGINPAGRASFHHGYRRIVLDALDTTESNSALRSLASLMNIDVKEGGISELVRDRLINGTLIRQIEAGILDTEAVDYNHGFKLAADGGEGSFTFELRRKDIPKQLPEGWLVSEIERGSAERVSVQVASGHRLLVPSKRELNVRAAGQLPTGFNPSSLYQARNHPRGLQMTVFGASDAIRSIGIDWDTIAGAVSPDQISVYAGSGMSQLDSNANGGMMSARFKGKRVTSKQCPLGFAEMPADFINAYILGSMGTTGTSMGACASFLYNLRQGITDIQSGKSRVVLVGNSEAPIVPEIVEGYSAMGALATDKELRALDGGEINYRRACRPFGNNCGFTLSESAQFVVLFDDTLAFELGANIYGAATDVFINADGYKKSISAPGVGNYLTVAKAVASAKGLLGEEAIKHRSYIQAHGTGTPQNRVTESAILNRVAEVYGIKSWPVVAVKSYLGHSIGVAGADQLAVSLGVWNDGILPGISSIDGPADDVECGHLDISPEHKKPGVDGIDVAIINSKGFGGNNATATVVSPDITRKIIKSKHKKRVWKDYQQRLESTLECAKQYDDAMTGGSARPIYRFDHNVLDGDALDFNQQRIAIRGAAHAVDLTFESPYKKWLD